MTGGVGVDREQARAQLNPEAERFKTGWGPFWSQEDDERLFDATPTPDEVLHPQLLQAVHGADADVEGLMAAGHRPSAKDVEIARLRHIGMVHPIWTWERAVAADIPRSLLASLLFQESGGGHNVWGHDPTIFVGAGTVTHAGYERYHHERGTPGRHMQGCGPMQLTWWEFQDDADRRGGCWVWVHNVSEGASSVGALIHRYGWTGGIQRYNGSGAAAVAYERAVTARQRRILVYLRTGHW